MKLLQLILLLFIIVSCNQENIGKVEYQYSNDEKDNFLHFVYKGYKKDGKYFLAGCSKFFGDLEKEINLNESFYGKPDKHSSIKYKIVELNSDSIKIVFESNSSYRDKSSKRTGFFSIECHDEKDIINKFEIEGIEVNRELAKKNIEEGKIFFLFKPENKINFSGTDYLKDDCWKSKFKKYGFEDYYISECMPIEKYYQQMAEYNDEVFKYLSKSKKLAFKNYQEMRKTFDEEVNECELKKENKKKPVWSNG